MAASVRTSGSGELRSDAPALLFRRPPFIVKGEALTRGLVVRSRARPNVYGGHADVVLLTSLSSMCVAICLVWLIALSTWYARHYRDFGVEVPCSDTWCLVGPT